MDGESVVLWVDDRGEFILDNWGGHKDFELLQNSDKKIVRKSKIPFRFRMSTNEDVGDFESTLQTFDAKHIYYMYDVTLHAKLKQLAARNF